jgi:hypothetical protein
VTDGQTSPENLHQMRSKNAREPWLEAGSHRDIRDMKNARKEASASTNNYRRSGVI